MYSKCSEFTKLWIFIFTKRFQGVPDKTCQLSHYGDVIMGTVASQITSLTTVYSTVWSGADQRKHQSSASLAFVRGNSPVTGELSTQMSSNAENISIWWRHHKEMILPVIHTRYQPHSDWFNIDQNGSVMSMFHHWRSDGFGDMCAVWMLKLRPNSRSIPTINIMRSHSRLIFMIGMHILQMVTISLKRGNRSENDTRKIRYMLLVWIIMRMNQQE